MTRKALSIIFGALFALAFVVIAPNVRASEVNQATQLTFNQPVELPGNVVLPAGTYWFTLPQNGISDPNLVMVYNADRSQLVTSTLTIPTTRMDTTSHSELTFGESSANQPIALINWFYPGRLTGHEFIYSPTEQAKLSEGEQFTVTVQPAPLVQAG